MHSRITDKYQTTIPREIREKLKLTRRDSLEWTCENGVVIVRPSKKSFLDYRGCIHLGPGDIDTDIDAAKRRAAEKNDD